MASNFTQQPTHRALLLPEIVYAILEFLDTSDLRFSTRLVNRMFSEMSLDLIWQEPHFDAIEVLSGLHDPARRQHFAGRICSLRIESKHKQMVTSLSLSFPRLKRLEIMRDLDQEDTWMDRFLTPNLEYVSFEDQYANWENDHDADMLFARLAQQPNLKDVFLAYDECAVTVGNVRAAFQSTQNPFEALTHLVIWMRMSAAMLLLPVLRSLADLTLHITDYEEDKELFSYLFGCRHLQRLSLDGLITTTAMQSALEQAENHVLFRNLKRLELYLSSQAASLLLPVFDGTNNSLTTLELAIEDPEHNICSLISTMTGLENLDLFFGLGDGDFSENNLCTLSSLKQLRSLKYEYIGETIINSEDLVRFVSSFPHLRDLQLCVRWDLDIIPSSVWAALSQTSPLLKFCHFPGGLKPELWDTSSAPMFPKLWRLEAIQNSGDADASRDLSLTPDEIQIIARNLLLHCPDILALWLSSDTDDTRYEDEIMSTIDKMRSLNQE